MMFSEHYRTISEIQKNALPTDGRTLHRDAWTHSKINNCFGVSHSSIFSHFSPANIADSRPNPTCEIKVTDRQNGRTRRARRRGGRVSGPTRTASCTWTKPSLNRSRRDTDPNIPTGTSKLNCMRLEGVGARSSTSPLSGKVSTDRLPTFSVLAGGIIGGVAVVVASELFYQNSSDFVSWLSTNPRLLAKQQQQQQRVHSAHVWGAR